MKASRIALVFGGWMTVWWSIIGALVAPVVPGGWLSVVAFALVASAPLLRVMAGFTKQHYPGAFERVWIMRPFWYLQIALPVLGTAGVLGTLAGWPFGAAGAGGRWALLVVFALLALLAVAGYVGSQSVVVKALDSVHPDLPAEFDGLRIAQISDLHVGPHTPRGFLARVQHAVTESRADLVAITGDQVDDHAPDVQHFAAAFRSLTAPLGVYAIAGNHDVYAGWSHVRRGLEAMGVRVLVNEALAITRGAARLWLAGTGDPAAIGWARDGAGDAAPDVGRTLSNVPRDAFTVALAHNPALWPALAKRGVQLTLSGHTHYGQFSIPRLKWSLASPFLRHAMGSHQEGKSLLYINPGTNYWGLKLRIGAWPEVTVITLRRGLAAGMVGAT
jgi:predicted MPP superfamily phosphohydrolase